MASDIWAMFQEYLGSGIQHSAAWIRPGHVEGDSFTWNGEAIPFPDDVWYRFQISGGYNYYSGYIATDPRDNDKLWVSAHTQSGSARACKCYVYSISAGTWSLVLNLPFTIIPEDFTWIVDMVFDPDGTTFACVAGIGAMGDQSITPQAGIYKSVAYGPLVYQGAGHQYAYNSGNINVPASVTGLTMAGQGAGTRKLVAAHTLTRISGSDPFGFVTSTSDDDGMNWAEPVTYYNGNRFQEECMTVIALPFGDDGALWYVADHSGAGAYSFADQTFRIDGSITSGPNGIHGGPVATPGTICYPFGDSSGLAVGFPTAHDHGALYNSANAGSTWAATARPTGNEAGFAYRGGRVSRENHDAAGVAVQGTDGASHIWWTEDGGSTWHDAVAESGAIGLSLDFAPSTPPVIPQVVQEVLVFHDSRRYLGRSRFYVSAPDSDAARTQAENIATSLANLSNASWDSATGPFTTEPGPPGQGLDDLYQNIEMILRLTWECEDDVQVSIEVPCPSSALFLSDQESLSLLNPLLADIQDVVLANGLCTRGGMPATSFLGGTRIMRGFRNKQNILTLTPDESGTNE